MLELTREILHISPGIRGLTLAERSRRVADAFDAALQRLANCTQAKALSPGGQANTSTPSFAAPDGLQLLYSSAAQRKSGATVAALRKDPDSLEPTMDFVFEVERATQGGCPNPTPTDRALLQLANNQRGSLQ